MAMFTSGGPKEVSIVAGSPGGDQHVMLRRKGRKGEVHGGSPKPIM